MHMLISLLVIFVSFFWRASIAQPSCFYPRSILATASEDKSIKIFDFETQCVLTLSGHSENVNELAFSKNKKYLFSASDDKTVKIWEVETGKLMMTMNGHVDYVKTVNVSPDDELIISGGWDNSVKIWSAKNYSMLKDLKTDYKVLKLSFSADGMKVISGQMGGIIEVFDVNSGNKILRKIVHSDWIQNLVITKDKRYLITTSKDCTAKQLDLSNGLQEVREFKGHTATIKGLAINPLNDIIATASDDKIILLWELNSGVLLKKLSNNQNLFVSLEFSHNGKYLFSGSSDNTVMIWDVAKGTLLTTLNPFPNTGKYILDLKIIELCNKLTGLETQGDFCNCENESSFPKTSFNNCSYSFTSITYGSCQRCDNIICDTSCETCTAAGVSKCLSCKSTSTKPYHESPNTGVEGQCVTTCSEPNPYGDNSTGRCQSICPLPYFGFSPKNMCVSTCPYDYYTESITRKCVKCDPTCETCSSGGPLKCRTCSPLKEITYHQSPIIDSDGACLSKCIAPYPYADDLTKRCYDLCPESRWGLPATGKCETSCPPEYYQNIKLRFCEKCHADCATCSAGGSNNCRSCIKNSDKPYHDVPAKDVDGHCVSICPTNYPYSDDNTGACYLNCPPTTRVDTSRKKCNICEYGFYGDSESNLCKPCDASCETCSAAGESKCLSCKTTSVKPYHESSSTGGEGQCVTTCSEPNPYGDDSTSRCQSICPLPYFGLLLMNKCVISCPLDYFINSINRKCEQCDPTCETCSSVGPSKCRTCPPLKDTKYHQSPIIDSDGSCVNKCMAPYPYADDSTKRCYSLCPDSRWGLAVTGKCETSCPSEYYVNFSEKLCKLCSESIKFCKICKSSSICTLCISGKLLLSNGDSSICVDECPRNNSLKYNEIKKTNKCIYCPERSFYDEATDECVNQRCQSKDCTLCEKNRTICEKCGEDLVLTNSTCLAFCELGYYKKEGLCLPCPINCLMCSFENEKIQCLKCYPNFILNETECIISCDPRSYYQMLNETAGICQPCHLKCEGCFGGDEMSCLSCKNDKFTVLSGTVCLNICESNSYLCSEGSPTDENLKITLDPYINGGGSSYDIAFSKSLSYSNALNLTKLVDVKVGNLDSEKYSYTVNPHPEEKGKMVLSISFLEPVNSPKVLVSLNERAPQYLKDENNLPIKMDTQVATNISIPVVVEPIEKNGTKLNDNGNFSESSSYSLYSLSSFIIFANIFSYTLNIERISTIWLYFDAIQTVSLFAFIDASHSKDLRHFLSSSFFSHADFISFFGKSICSSNNTILLNGKALKQQIYPNNFYIYLGTASFSANGFQAVIFILILALTYLISSLIIVYYWRKGEADHKIPLGCDTYKNIMFPVIIRCIYFFFSLVSMTSLLQMAYFNNPAGIGNYSAVLSLIFIMGFLAYSYRFVINKEEVYLSEEEVARYEPIFADVKYEEFLRRNHHLFILTRKLLVSIFIVAFKAKPILAAILILILFLLSVIKNLLRNPFNERKLFFLAIGTDALVAVIAIIEIAIVKNDSDMKSFTGIIPINMLEKQASYCKAFMALTLLICSIYFAFALLLFVFYACKHITCFLSLLTGELGMMNINPEFEIQESEKGTPKITANSSRNLVEIQFAKNV